ILGDADRVRTELQQDATLATRPDTRTGWTALHAACSSRWHQIEPARADGLATVARLLLEPGADPTGPTPSPPPRPPPPTPPAPPAGPRSSPPEQTASPPSRACPSKPAPIRPGRRPQARAAAAAGGHCAA